VTRSLCEELAVQPDRRTGLKGGPEARRFGLPAFVT
jgi:hypothetical protein